MGPICTGRDGSLANCVSPRLRKKLACRNREGEIPVGSEEESVSPEAVIANCSVGISLSIRAKRALISRMMLSNSS